MSKPKLICVVGPTAARKTETAVRICEQFGGEVLSADSVAVYRGLDIGSAKPTLEERRGVPHHLIDCADCADASFSVSAFRDLALSAIDDILARGRLPVVVGGSGLYVDAILSPFAYAAPSDPALRKELETAYEQDRDGVLWELNATDPVTAQRLSPNDKKRIVRALEVCRVSGTAFSEWNRAYAEAQQLKRPFAVTRIGLTFEREALYRRIDARVEDMFSKGLVEEAQKLLGRGLSPSLPAMQAIGYRQLWPYLMGLVSLDEAKERCKLDTRHYAKRQLTWFRRDKDTRWFTWPSEGDPSPVLHEILQYVEESLTHEDIE